LWTGQLISMTGRQITLVAVAYQVYVLTGSTLAVGMLGLVQAVPLIVAGLYAGALADRFDRKLVMLASLGVLGLTSLGLALGAASGRPPLWFIYAVTAISAGVSTAEHAARSATVPRLVGPRRLPAALSLTQVLFQFALVAGPSAAGVVIAAAGLRWAYAIDVACFATALVCVLMLHPLPPTPEGRAVVIGWRAPAEALAYARQNPVLLSLFAVDLNAMVFGMPRALFPALAVHYFGVGPQGLGLLYAAPGAGALVGSLLSGWVSRIRRQGQAVLWSVAAWGGAITLFGFSGGVFPLALVLLGVAGAADMISAVFRGTIIQLSTPDRLRGRVGALNSMVVTAGPRFGDVESGVVAALTSPIFSVVSGGILCLVGVAALAAGVPALRRQAANR
jgi:MFS family permease